MIKKNKIRLLFICLGNICRSPAAEGVMKAIVQRAGRADAYHIDSAGIGNWHVGQLPDSRMRKHGAARGYRFDSRAQQFTPADFERFDYILVMDHDNFRAVTAKAPTATDAAKVKMLTDYLQHHAETDIVPDPYYGDSADFNYALDLIEDACAGLFKALQKDE